ncbi:MAG: hypothetical protein AAGD05_18595, partial [Bacteroidota bacterium]
MKTKSNWLLVFLLMLLVGSPISWSQEAIVISIVNDDFDRESELDWFQDKVKSEISNLLRNRVAFEFREQYGDYDPQKIQNAYDQAFADPDVDIVIGLGAFGCGILAQRPQYAKPSIAAIVLDEDLQKVPYTPEGTSGVTNFTYIQSPFSIKRDLQMLHRMRPYQKLGVIGGNDLVSSFPFIKDLIDDIVDSLNVTAQLFPYPGSVDQLLSNIPAEVDAVYVFPLFDEVSPQGLETLFQGLHEKELASMAMLGENYIDKGALMGYEADDNLQRLPRRIALNVLKIVEGAPAADLPISIPTFNENLLINMAAARASGVYPDFDLMSEAILTNLNEFKTDR